jgi:hypothetical protein
MQYNFFPFPYGSVGIPTDVQCVKSVAHEEKPHHLCNVLDPWDCCNPVQKVIKSEAFFFAKYGLISFSLGKNENFH